MIYVFCKHCATNLLGLMLQRNLSFRIKNGQGLGYEEVGFKSKSR